MADAQHDVPSADGDGLRPANGLHVRDVPARSRYELVSGEQVLGYADYRRSGTEVVLPHTVIEPARRGAGLGAVLVRGALDDLARRGDLVVPQCWFVREFIEAHAEYAPLVAR